ncbi:hypothetical protein [Fontivita pretiosa]|jgi:hypothetical protein|uniref:hypothetical protein n=1 Tax=Fontivita pretiosa TaxID=2989684 RepID=UPI003D17D762
MKRSRQVLAIALLAAALCADRAVAAAPALRPRVTTVASRLVTRLSVSFSRVVPSVRFFETRRLGIVAESPRIEISDASECHRLRLSPLLLRLPPPVC